MFCYSLGMIGNRVWDTRLLKLKDWLLLEITRPCCPGKPFEIEWFDVHSCGFYLKCLFSFIWWHSHVLFTLQFDVTWRRDAERYSRLLSSWYPVEEWTSSSSILLQLRSDRDRAGQENHFLQKRRLPVQRRQDGHSQTQLQMLWCIIRWPFPKGSSAFWRAYHHDPPGHPQH